MNPTSLKFKTITVATDLSDSSSTALRYAQAIARLHHSTLVVIHVLDPVGYAFAEGTPATLASDEPAREELVRIEDEAREQGIPVRSIMERGIVCERILQALLDHHADLLILGTKARTEAGRVALGRIARQLLAKSPCPVLTVSPDADAVLPWAGQWRHVLAAIDFSEVSVAALTQAHHIAHRQLIALHVAATGSGPECAGYAERLRYLAPLDYAHTVPVEHIAISGDPVALIASYAAQFNADLVVLGSPATELTEGQFAGSTVLGVISAVKCPVLCVPIQRVDAERAAHELVFAR